MSYLSIVEMAGSPSLTTRIVAAAADEGHPDPLNWAQSNIWGIVAESSDWATNWDYAKAAASPNVNPDTGVRTDVITDAMILSVVQPMVSSLMQQSVQPQHQVQTEFPPAGPEVRRDDNETI